ncbi:hypothetical protein CF326_g3731 [Tilletia indica]|nr:hypothetical protein CF326_g3731 [Tilletia indica]
MSSSSDPFAPVRTEQLRNVALHYYRNSGASRMDRASLSMLLLEGILHEERSLFDRLARCQSESPDIWKPRHLPNVLRQLRERYGDEIVDLYLLQPLRENNALPPYLPQRAPEAPQVYATSSPSPTATSEEPNTEDDSWPSPISQQQKNDCMQAFRAGTDITIGPTCSVCARRSFNKDIIFQSNTVHCRRVDAASLNLDILRITDEHILGRQSDEFTFACPSLQNLALCQAGVVMEGDKAQLEICQECHNYLSHRPPKLPPLSLKNGNIRGTLPPHLRDVTWLEERLCAKYLASACVVRLYDVTAPSAPAERARVMKGHTCAFPLNTISTATKLPWAVGDGGAMVSCLVIGPRKPRMEDLKHVFKVRRQKVYDLLSYLRDNFQGYPEVEIDLQAIQSLPVDNIPELLMRYVVHHETGNVPSLFDQETSGIEPHPSTALDSSDDTSTSQTFLERHGMIDINGTKVPAHERMATALLSTVTPTDNTGTNLPDLVIRYGSSFIKEYGNPDLFPGMFPTLFPWGIGGFEEFRTASLSPDRQAQYLLDLADPSFRRHWSFIFVIANLKQRRAIHNQSRIACTKSDFPRISRVLRSLDASTIKSIHEHISQGGSTTTLTSSEQRIHTLIKKCELLSVHVPGSKGAMNRARAEIRAYTGAFGIFHLFLTLTPSTAHCPGFHIFYGDSSVRLDVRDPQLPSASGRAIRVAEDPVAAADFFHFHIHAVFKYLFGWDFKRKESSTDGGILGNLAAFYLVREHTMRGQLHGHALIWLKGAPNPDVLRARLRTDPSFQARYLAFFDDLIVHQSPGEADDGTVHDKSARIQRPPDPDEEDYEKIFNIDHHRLAEGVQRHKCGFTCFKGGRDSCRFMFPHDTHAAPSFDAETNSINPRILDPTMNWHNPTLLVATRHNQDLRSVQSGKSSAAAAAYITSYATKSEETPANQISMINTVFQRMDQQGQDLDDVKALLVKCVMQFGRERQIHAQQAATYTRDLADTMSSHPTKPMLSGRLYLHVLKTCGPLRGAVALHDPPVGPTPLSTDHSDVPNAESRNMDVGVAVASSVNDDTNHNELDDSEDSSDDDHDLIPLSASGSVHQLEDYLHRGPTLSHLNYYEFVQFCKLVPIPKKSQPRFHRLSQTHPQQATSCHRYTPDKGIGIPRAVYSSFPRPNGTASHGDAYCAMMLAHFHPFTDSQPLKQMDDTYEAAFAAAQFNPAARSIISNWRALSECEDARDADMLKRRKQEACRDAKASEAAFVFDGAGPSDDADADLIERPTETRTARELAELTAFAAPLSVHNWFQSGNTSPTHSQPIPTTGLSPRFTTSNCGKWTKERVLVEAAVTAEQAAPRASTGILAQELGFPSFDASTSDGASEAFPPGPLPALETQRLRWNGTPPEDVIAGLIVERNLTPSQQLAFTIVARRFFQEMNADNTQEPLRLLMHGEAGTGKTVVVRLLKELLERFGKGNEILLMAPTGKAAAAIGGSTQHSTFVLKVRKKKATTEERGNETDVVTPMRIRKLQDRLAGIKWLFFDEISMTSCEVLSDIDQALRLGTCRPNDSFGGLNVLFAGDFCQLPPVASVPLYTKTSSRALNPETRTKIELGKAAWRTVNEVVEFVEQMRMQDDEMSALLSRMRVRNCNTADVSLLNQSVLRRTVNDLSLKNHGEAIVLAQTNEAVRVFNHQKAASQALGRSEVVRTSVALDKTNGNLTLEQRLGLLKFNGNSRARTGLARIPMYVGMPVVFRGGNLSVPLGVTNGAFATVVDWDLIQDAHGFEVPRGVVLRFHNDAEWKLDDFPSGCLPITPSVTSFNYQMTAQPQQSVSRRQLPIQPGFAMTTHSAQGITSKTGIITDLRAGGFEAYVAASRATRRSDVFLVAPVTLSDLNMPPLPRALKQELARLQLLADATKARHASQAPRPTASGGESTARNELTTARPRDDEEETNLGRKRCRLSVDDS